MQSCCVWHAHDPLWPWAYCKHHTHGTSKTNLSFGQRPRQENPYKWFNYTWGRTLQGTGGEKTAIKNHAGNARWCQAQVRRAEKYTKVNKPVVAVAARDSEHVSHGSNPRPPALIPAMSHIIKPTSEAPQAWLAWRSPDSQKGYRQKREAQQLQGSQNLKSGYMKRQM